MNLKFTFLSTLAWLGLCHASHGQTKAHIGVTSGYNSTFVLDQGLRADPRYISQATYNFSPVGLALGMAVTPRYALQLETILAKQGQLFYIVDAAQQKIGERKIDLEYIHLPLLLKKIGSQGTGRGVSFMIGPQLSLLRNGLETYFHSAAKVRLPEGVTPPPHAVSNPDGTYDVPAVPETIIFSSSATDVERQFRDLDLQIAFGLGYDIRLNPALFLSTNLRGNYGLLDMRNEDMIDALQNRTASIQDLFGRRANLLLGLQLGLNYQIGRSLKRARDLSLPTK